MTASRPGRGAGLALLAIILGALAGCSSVESQPIADAPKGVTVLKLSGVRPTETPPDPRTAALSLFDVEASLRRIVVRYIKFTTLFQTDPRPLLSDEEIVPFAQILVRELPKLTATQRIRFRFADRYFGEDYEIEMEVYREGPYLDYWFNALATNIGSSMASGENDSCMALLEQGPGQIAANLITHAYLKDRLWAEQADAVNPALEKQRILDDAGKDKIFSTEELPRLEAMAAAPLPSIEAWKAFIERRRKLKKALDEDIIDPTGYQAQVNRLYGEMDNR